MPYRNERSVETLQTRISQLEREVADLKSVIADPDQWERVTEAARDLITIDPDEFTRPIMSLDEAYNKLIWITRIYRAIPGSIVFVVAMSLVIAWSVCMVYSAL